MEENVALDSSKQKQFIKSIKGIKKILKVKDKAKTKKENVDNVQTGKIKKPLRKKRGLVYLSHIPHGFYEHQMTEYFKQFGVVTNARVIRSKRTGMSKGHAFVEFRDPNVAEIVAETMNNYLMGKRLIKASVIPPEKQRKFAKRKHWNAQNNPGAEARQKSKKAHNSVKDEKEDLQIAKKLLSNLNKTKKRLRELDIDYDFFTAVDIPEPLLNLVEVKKEEDVKTTDVIKKETKLKNKVKQEDVQNENKKEKKVNVSKDNAQVITKRKQGDSTVLNKSKKSTETQQSDDKTKFGKLVKDNVKNTKAEKEIAKETKNNKQVKKAETKINMSETQKQKTKKLKEAGVKPPEDFIQIQKDSDDDSESSVNFDSDEYDKEVEQDDSDVESDDESDADLDEDITSEEDESDEDKPSPPKKVARPSKMKFQAAGNKEQGRKPNAKPPPQEMKRMPQKDTKPSKKPKFEKKNKKTMNKVIKKKK